VDGYRGTQQDVQDPGSSVDIYTIAGISDNIKDGDKVIALFDNVNDRYYALPKPAAAKAAWISFTLYEDAVAGPTTFLATVNDFWGGEDPSDGDGRVNLVDRHSLFPDAKKPDSTRGGGCKGYACYDPEEDVYVVVVCQQLAHMLRCMTAEAFAAGDTEFDVSLATDAVFAIGREQWSKIPVATTLTVKNILGFDGDSGAWCYIVWNITAQQWELLQIACPA
jgi:hypothetical protein